MKVRNILLTITAGAIIAAAGVVFAQHGPGGPGGGGAFGNQGGHGLLRMLPRLADKLDLTQEQQGQIQAIIDTGKPELDALKEQAQIARDEFRELYSMGDFNETAFRSHFESQAQLHVEMQLIGAEMTSHAFAVLTPEQQQELLDLMELFRDDRGGPRHSGGKRHGVR